MADAPTLELRIQSNADQAIKGLQKLADALNTFKQKLSNGLGVDAIVKELAPLKNAFESTFSPENVTNVTNMANALERISRAKGGALKDIAKSAKPISNMKPIDSAIAEAKSETGKIASPSATVQSVANETKAIKDRLNARNTELIIRNKEQTVRLKELDLEKKTLQTQKTQQDILKIKNKMLESTEKGTKAIDKNRMSFSALGKAADKVITPLGKVIRAFGRIAFYRVVRSILKYIGEGFKEGIGNVRAYSEAINGSFNSAMTSAEATLLKVKNSLGAALAPALEAIVPLLQTLANWFITVINLANQLIALLTGKSQWTRATDASTESLDNVKKSAGGAAKAVKNLLAGFDELNIIQSESGGGGGGGGAITPDYTNMFEEVFTFDQKIREVAEWLKANFEDILKIAGDIGAVLLAWRVSKNFTGILGTLGGLIGTAILIKLEWDVTGFFDKQFLESGEPGWLIGNLLTSALGAKLASEAIGKIGAGQEVRLAVGAITLGVSAAADINAFLGDFKINGVTQNNLAVAAAGALKGGVAGLLVAKMLGLSPIGLAVGAAAATVAITVALAVAVNANKKDLKWGKNELTDEAIEAWVNKNMFSINVPLQIKLVGDAVTAVEDAQNDLLSRTGELTKDLNVLRLGINRDDDYEKVITDIRGTDGKGGIIKTIEELINAEKNVVGVALTAVPYINEAGEDVSKVFSEQSSSGWSLVEEYVKGKAKKLDEYLVPNTNQLRKDLKDYEREAVDAIIATFNRISNALTQSKISTEGIVDLNMSLSSMTEKSVKNAMKQYGDYKQNLYSSNLSAEYAKAADAKMRYDMANIMLEDDLLTDEQRKSIEAQAEAAKADYDYLSKNAVANAQRAAESAAEVGKDVILQAINDITEGAVNDPKNYLNVGDLIQYKNEAINSGREGTALRDLMLEMLTDDLKTSVEGLTGMSTSEFGEYGINILDLIPKTIKEQYLGDVANVFGLDVANALAEAIGTNVPEEVTKAIEDAQAEAIRQTKLQEADDAWGKVKEQRKEVERLRQEIQTTEENMTSADFFNTDYLTAELSEAEQALAEMTAEATAMYEALGVTPPPVNMSGVTGPLNSAKNSVHSDVESILRDFNRLNGLSFEYSTRSHGMGNETFDYVLPFADGGFVGTGDMFIARESGPELVGRIGNRTAVANNDQIVAGVASGVASGQAEQNALLRQQNDLLRQMVAKSGRVEAVPSAAWGRFIRSSSEMYANNAGV